MQSNISILPETGYVRLKTILAILPMSASSWWAGVKDGRYPQPVKLGPRTTAWRVEDIRALLEELNKQLVLCAPKAQQQQAQPQS